MKLNPRFYQNTPTGTWKGRIDGTDLSAERWHQRIICFNLLEEELPTIPFSAPFKSEFPTTEKETIALRSEKSTLAAGNMKYQLSKRDSADRFRLPRRGTTQWRKNGR